MRILRKFWWVVAVAVAVWWYRKRATPTAYNGVPKYLDPASRGAAYANGSMSVDDFTKSLFGGA